MISLQNKMANIFIPSFVDLPADVFPYIFKYLDVVDMIAVALTCHIFKQICVDAKVFRKMDLSRRPVSTTQRGEINKFFRDRQLTQHIKELNISNLRVLNWQMDDQLEEFITSICPHLEALHVLDCGISLQRLHHILKQAPKLTALSWSVWDFTSEDTKFLVKNMKSSDESCSKNIKHLHLEILHSVPHIQLARYLLLSCFRDLEELEIYTWWTNKEYLTGWNFPLPVDQFIPSFPQPSSENELQHLHSLMVVTVGGPSANYGEVRRKTELYDFVVSVLSRKSSSTKWKKFWVLPSVGIDRLCRTDLLLLLNLVHSDDFQSVEAIAADLGWSPDALVEFKTFFERIGDSTVRSLHLYLPYCSDSIVELYDPILSVGGHSLKHLRLFGHYLDEKHAEKNIFIPRLLSNCLNITELDLLYCYFEKDICEPLSKLKYLVKVQLMQCAISSKYNRDHVEISKTNLLIFVENCKNITHFDVRGCVSHEHFSCCLTDGDLLALVKLRNLKSLTLYQISGISQWEFLQNMSEQWKHLTMLRISAREHFNNPMFLETAKFLKHLAIDVPHLPLGSDVFWNLLSHAANLERLCIRSFIRESLNIPIALETIKSLPRLHVLHLHSRNIENVDDFYDQIIRMLEEKGSDCRFSFEIVLGNNHMSQYSMIFNEALRFNEAELCDMRPILDIPRF